MISVTRPIAIIVADYYADISSAMLQGVYDELLASDITKDQILTSFVPGAVEIPLIAQQYAKKNVAAVITLGAVIRGETAHFDYVCQQVSTGCQKVGLRYDIPVIFGIVTTENMQQVWDRLGGNHGHKGKQAAQAALRMITLMEQLNEK